VAAAIDQQARLARRGNRRAEIDAPDRAARALGGLAVAGDDEGGSAGAVLDPAGDDADDAGMPALAIKDHHGAVVLPAGEGEGFVEDRLLDPPALGIQPVQLDGDADSLLAVVGGQKADAEIRETDAPAGVDARPDQKARVVGAGRPVHPRNVGKRRQARLPPRGENLQPLRHQGAVESRQRDHVADGADGTSPWNAGCG
jgi:hypothetical protein